MLHCAAVVLAALSAAAAPQDPIVLRAAGPAIAVGPMAGRPVIADFDGDGRADVVVACGTCCGSRPDPDSGHVVLLLGDGRGGLHAAKGSPHKVCASTRKVAVGDVDGDGHLDVVAASHDSDDFVVLLGDGRGGLTMVGEPRPLGASRRPHTHDVVLADLDGDGRLDVLATQSNEHRLAIARGDGKGGFAAPWHVRIARHPYDAIAVADFDRDGRADVAVPDLLGGAVTVLLQHAGGTFDDVLEHRDRQFPVLERPGYVVAADFDGDAALDLAVTHDDVGDVVLLRGDGRGGFAPFAGSPLHLPEMAWGIAAADFDGDHVTDLAFGTAAAAVLVVRGDGKGGFGTPTRCAAGARSNYVAAGDLDGDGGPDLVAASYADGTLTVFLTGR